MRLFHLLLSRKNLLYASRWGQVLVIAGLLSCGKEQPSVPATPAAPAASRVANTDDWPDFRGPTADGHVADGSTLGFPLEWDEAQNKNVAWKTPIHDEGLSSPVIEGKALWLTSATLDGTKMFALRLDKDSGKITHDILVFENAAPEPIGNPVNHYASPSPTIEKGHVYVHFGTFGTACLDSETGQKLWQRRDINCVHIDGPGSSPILYKDLLIVTMDGADTQYVIALNKRTGETVWKTNRTTEWHDVLPDGTIKDKGDFRKAFSTPVVANMGGSDILLSVGAQNIFGYNPSNGQELWKYNHGGYSIAPRPLFGDGLVYMMTVFPKGHAWGLKVDATTRGTLTESAEAWHVGKHVARIASPLLVGGELYMMADDGTLTCLNAKSGKVIWMEKLAQGNYSASPLFADGRIYVSADTGVTTVIQPGRVFKKLAENKLAEGGGASMAASGRAFFLRGKSALYRLEDMAAKGK